MNQPQMFANKKRHPTKANLLLFLGTAEIRQLLIHQQKMRQ
jgi:hypothetical protein